MYIFMLFSIYMSETPTPTTPAPSSSPMPSPDTSNPCSTLSAGSPAERAGRLVAYPSVERSERYAQRLTCGGLELRFTRRDDGVASPGHPAFAWDTVMRSTPTRETATTATASAVGNSSVFHNLNGDALPLAPLHGHADPIVVAHGAAMNQSTHNAAFYCDTPASTGRLFMYGGRVGKPVRGPLASPTVQSGHDGLLRWEGDVTALGGVRWDPTPLVVLDAKRAAELGCAEGRRAWEGSSCELDGKLSVVAEFHGRLWLYARFNPAMGLRYVQVASAPATRPLELGRFEPISFANSSWSSATANIYFLAVTASADGQRLVGLFPGFFGSPDAPGTEGGVWYSESRDGATWSDPLLLMPAAIEKGRTDLHPVGGFEARADGSLAFEVDHRIDLYHSEGGEPPFTCAYELGARALVSPPPRSSSTPPWAPPPSHVASWSQRRRRARWLASAVPLLIGLCAGAICLHVLCGELHWRKTRRGRRSAYSQVVKSES